MTRSIRTDDYTWAGRTYADVNDLAAEDGSILLVPVGSLEQHGDHLPTGTDTILADSIVALGAERIGGDAPILTLPPVWTGFSPHHRSFGGTVTIGSRALQRHLEAIADSVLSYEFDVLLFLNGHGGNTAPVDAAIGAVGSTHPDSQVFGLTYFHLAAPFIDEIRDSETGGMGHGGEFETSLMLYLEPDLVDEDGISTSYQDEPYSHASREMFDSGPMLTYRSFGEYSETGVVGDPTLATAEKGERIYRRLGDEFEALLREVHEPVS